MAIVLAIGSLYVLPATIFFSTQLYFSYVICYVISYMFLWQIRIIKI